LSRGIAEIFIVLEKQNTRPREIRRVLLYLVQSASAYCTRRNADRLAAISWNADANSAPSAAKK
jgi:hypothetical protein